MPRKSSSPGADRPVVVVEPHPDDAFLSLGWHLEHLWRDRERLIVTVFCDDRRGGEAVEYARAVGAGSLRLSLPESKMLSPARPLAIPELTEFLKPLSGAQLVFPMGLQHPDHLRVAATRPPGAFVYMDAPYLSKQKLAADVLLRAQGRRLASILFPPKRKWRHHVIYKSQSKFFHYNPLWEFKLPEVLLHGDIE